MESYVIRIYRREGPGGVTGLLIDSASGGRQLFHSVEELTSQLLRVDGEGVAVSVGGDTVEGNR